MSAVPRLEDRQGENKRDTFVGFPYNNITLTPNADKSFTLMTTGDRI